MKNGKPFWPRKRTPKNQDDPNLKHNEDTMGGVSMTQPKKARHIFLYGGLFMILAAVIPWPGKAPFLGLLFALQSLLYFLCAWFTLKSSTP